MRKKIYFGEEFNRKFSRRWKFWRDKERGSTQMGNLLFLICVYLRASAVKLLFPGSLA